MASIAAPMPYLKVEGFAYTQPNPYSEFISDWSSGYKGGNEAIQHSWLEVGVEYGNWGIAIIRQDYASLHFSEDTADFYYLSENRLPLTIDYRYNIDITSNYTSLEGLRLFHRVVGNERNQLTAALNFLKGKELLRGRLYGDVTVLAEDDYEFDQLKIDYYYSDDLLFDRVVEAPTGEGYSIDLYGSWQATPQLLFDASLINLLGHITWKNTPFTTAIITSDNKEYDSNGYVIVHPALSGKHETRRYRQEIPTIFKLNAQATLTSQSQLLGELITTNQHHFISVGAGFKPSNGHQLKTLFTMQTHAITIAYQNNWLSSRITLDNPELGKARHLALQLNLQFPF